MSIMMTPGRVTYNLGPLQKLPSGEGRTFLIGNLLIAIFRSRKDEVFATQAACPHKGGPLADGIIGDGKVMCPLHAYRFNLATGEALGHSCSALKTYPISLSESGDVLLNLEA